MNIYVVTAPTFEPVTLAEARAHCHIDHALDDAVIAGYIVAARQQAEHELQRSLVLQTFELVLDQFPSGVIELPMGPIPAAGAIAVASVKYTDTAGAEQTVDPPAYTLDPYSNVPRLAPVTGWPTTKDTMNAVRVRYTSGAATAGTVPQAVKTWILLQVGHLYANREAATPATLTATPFVDRLLDAYRSFR